MTRNCNSTVKCCLYTAYIPFAKLQILFWLHTSSHLWQLARAFARIENT